MKTTLHIAFIFIALAVGPTVAEAQGNGPMVATAKDRTKTLDRETLTALSRSINLRLPGKRGLFLSPSVTELSIERYGRRVKVSCKVRIVVTQSTKRAVAVRAVIVEARAQLISSRRNASRAHVDCVAAAGAHIATAKLAAL